MRLGQIAAQTPDKPAVIMAGSGRSITFRELNEESNRLARLLRMEAAAQCPRTVGFRPELPRHPAGKLYKRLLKDVYWAQ